MMKRKILFAALTGMFLSASLFALGRGEDRPLRYALSGNPDTLDPHKTDGTLTFQVVKSVYDTLAEPDETGRIVPALAESWTVSADGRAWTFRLRRNVVFHDGTPFTSKDVKATLLRILDKAVASPRASEFTVISEIVIPDDHTVEIRLHTPSAPFLASLASGWGAILPASLIAAGHDFGSRPVGTGPFVFEEWIRDNKISLKKNASYWMSGKPKLSGVEFRVITERAVQVQGLLSGQIDVVDLYDSVDVPILEKNPDTKVQKNLTSLVMVMAMNASRPMLNDPRVRQAINHAVDKQKVLDIAYGGGVPVGTFMDHGDPYYRDFTKLYPYNPQRARQLLAHVEPGRTLEMVLPQNFEPHVRAGQLYQEMLAKVGLTVKIRLVDWSTWLADVHRGGNYDLTVIGHTGKLDPDNRLAGYGTERSYVRWVNLEAAKLIAEARTIVDPALRKTKYDRILEIMAKEAPFVYTGTSYRYIGMRKNVEGFVMQPKLDALDFRSARLK
jgi:peptide/nickel transport system substrate-binding protein